MAALEAGYSAGVTVFVSRQAGRGAPGPANNYGSILAQLSTQRFIQWAGEPLEWGGRGAGSLTRAGAEVTTGRARADHEWT